MIFNELRIILPLDEIKELLSEVRYKVKKFKANTKSKRLNRMKRLIKEEQK